MVEAAGWEAVMAAVATVAGRAAARVGAVTGVVATEEVGRVEVATEEVGRVEVVMAGAAREAVE